MSGSDRLERRLGVLLEDLAAPRTPDYFDDVLARTAAARQRPAWAIPERWNLMSAISSRLAVTPRAPLRAVGVAALLLLALLAAIAFVVGTQHTRVPAPFGPAQNGLVAFIDEDGNVRLGDAGTGTSRIVAPGPGNQHVAFSPDGTRLAIARATSLSTLSISIASLDGSAPRVVADQVTGVADYFGWTPDSRRIVADLNGTLATFAVSDGARTDVAVLDNGYDMNHNLGNVFRPPLGDEFLFYGSGPVGTALYRQPVAGGSPIPVLRDTPAFPFNDLAGAQWSPDGTRITVTVHPPGDDVWGRLYVVNADGTGLRRVSGLAEGPGEQIDEEHASWSPDGTRIAFARWINDAEGNNHPQPVTIVTLATGAEVAADNDEVNGYNGWSWSPDGKSIIQVPGQGSDHADMVLVVDAATGHMTRLPWTSPSAPSWQRVAP